MKVLRLKLIDVLLERYGHVNRRTLEDYFDLSTPQVSLDLQAYMEAAPGNMEYDKSARTYKRTASFQRKFKC